MFEQALAGILLIAHREAIREGASELRPGHLLLGLRLAPRQAAARFLADIPIERARAALAPSSSQDDLPPRQRDIPRSPDAERVIRRAAEEASRLGQALSPEHLLLALFDDEACARVLSQAGVSEATLRTRLLQEADTPVRLIIGASPDPALELVAYDPARHPQFAWVLTRAPFSGLETLSAVLANTSTRRVTALVARWTFTDADGKRRIRNIVVDDYFVYNRFRSLAPGHRVLVTPRGCVEPVAPEDRWSLVGILEQPEAAAVAATLEIDGAVFEDRRIVGPDTYDINAYIHGRYAAAVALMEDVQAAVDAGEDQEAALRRLSIQAINAPPPRVGHRWHFPSHSGEWLTQRRNLLPPPTFVRQ